ncbi:MAG TPA: aspartate aminotransferase family protein [Gammaproteobacteria bacterium]|nr:aspartate aminotransferase family protein [Gammaproteobacteria bacterium]
MTEHLMQTYARQPVSFTHGEGPWLWDTGGKRYLDALGGIAVCGLGHAHPAVTAALCEQASKLLHTSNLYGIEWQSRLADRLSALSGMDRVFFSNSGAEANETAIKIARLYGHARGINAPNIIVMQGSFHGRTMATLSATGNRKVQAGFEPLVQGFVRAPYNDLEAVRAIAANDPSVVAILVEPVQGEGGIVIPDADYLNGLREICDANDWLLMLDEIQTGMGRSGKWFAFQHNDITPDVMTLAKALGNGVPIGACLAHGAAAEVLTPGTHGSTFGGNPLACRAACAVVETLDQDGLVAKAAATGEFMQTALGQRLADLHGVREVRGMGMLLAIELDRPCGELVTQALQAGLLINVTAERVVRLLPPLIIAREQAETIVNTVADLIEAFLNTDN